MPTTLALPKRPAHYKQGNALSVGTYHIQNVVGGKYTIIRTVGITKWFPLTTRDDPAWLLFDDFWTAQAWATGGPEFDAADWPHWGH